MNFARWLTWVLLGVAALAPARAQTDEEARRWRLVVEHGQSSDLWHYLRAYPNGRHVAEARQRLMARQLQPLARLSAGGEACEAEIVRRAGQLLQGTAKRPGFAWFELRVDAARIAQTGSQEFLPPGQVDFASRPEAALALDLVAGRNGSCSLMERFSSGSGLPEACRCEPLDKSFRFESALAQSVLAEYAGFRGAQQGCTDAGHPADNERNALIEGFLDDWISHYTQWLQAIRSRQQRGATLFPSELGQAESVEFALPEVGRRLLDTPTFERARQATLARPAEQREALCAQQLPQRVEQARLRILLSTRLIKS